MTFDVEITVRFRVPNVGDDDDMRAYGHADVKSLVQWLIAEEGLVGIVDDPNGELLDVKRLN